MKTFKILSFIGYSLVALAGLAMGIMYTFADEIMPYHLDALGSSWEELNSGTQWMLLNYERSVAAGFITTSVALFFLLLFPLRKGETWSKIAAFVIPFVEMGNMALRTASVSENTPANPPLVGVISLLSITFISFIFSIISRR